ncbi:UNVERIFIED_CONTAM: hypothetical protein GTU68_057720 [Idotea baltica]|nr:hypothetical protein [Idotea baltica]
MKLIFFCLFANLGENGIIEGEYGYRTPDGCMHVVRYEATNIKYRVIGTSKRDCDGSGKRPLPRVVQQANQLPSSTLKPFISKLSKISPSKDLVTTTKRSVVSNTQFTTPRTTIETTKRPFVTNKPFVTKRRPLVTSKPFGTTRRSFFTSKRSTTTKRPFVTSKPFGTTKLSLVNSFPPTTKRPLVVESNPAITTKFQSFKTTNKPSSPTTRRPITTRSPVRRTTSSPNKHSNEIAGKQLFDSTGPPPNMKRPKVLSPDDPDPIYSFGFEARDHGHTQAGLPDGTKKGEFFYDSPDGWRRFVTYTASKNGFYPKLRRERIPGWEDSPLNPKNRFRDTKEGGKSGGKGGGTGGTGGTDGKGGKGGAGGENGGTGGDGEIGGGGKQLIPLLEPSNGCPYYFYTNTRINFHWERCLENGTRVGAYGRLADDGYSHRVSYYADNRGYRPRVTKIPLTREQEDTVAGFTQGAFIIPKIDEEKRETERRINEWIAQNQDRIDFPL